MNTAATTAFGTEYPRNVKAWALIGETCTADGNSMWLTKRDEEYVVLLNGKTLMSSRMHGSEEALATAGCRHLRTAERPRVLVGGLGMGFTLRAALDMTLMTGERIAIRSGLRVA